MENILFFGEKKRLLSFGDKFLCSDLIIEIRRYYKKDLQNQLFSGSIQSLRYHKITKIWSSPPRLSHLFGFGNSPPLKRLKLYINILPPPSLNRIFCDFTITSAPPLANNTVKNKLDLGVLCNVKQIKATQFHICLTLKANL